MVHLLLLIFWSNPEVSNALIGKLEFQFRIKTNYYSFFKESMKSPKEVIDFAKKNNAVMVH